MFSISFLNEKRNYGEKCTIFKLQNNIKPNFVPNKKTYWIQWFVFALKSKLWIIQYSI